MRKCAALATLLTTLLIGTMPQAHAGNNTARIRARKDFQHDLVSVLALRGQPRPLLGAALLARTETDRGGALDFHHLITRAAAAPGAGAGVSWARLGDCDAAAENCPNAAALDALIAQAPDNAAVWLLRMGQAMTNGHAKDAEQALQKAASASLYDDYTGRSLQALADTVMVLPPPSATLSGKGSHASQVVTLQVTMVYGIGGAQPLPGFHLVAAQCLPKIIDEQPQRRNTCLKLAQVLVWGSNPLARALGLHLQTTLDLQADVRDHADAAMRDLTWQVQQFGRLQARARTESGVAHLLLLLARQGGTEMSLMQAALRASDISVEAPSGWSPRTAARSQP